MRHISEYEGWEIAVTPRQEGPGRWCALIEAWPPGSSWRTREPRIVAFTLSAISQAEILGAARLHVQEWINLRSEGP